MDATRDHHFHYVQIGYSCVKIKFNKSNSKTKACNTVFTFSLRDSVTFFIGNCQQSDKDDNLEESFFEEKQSPYTDSFIVSIKIDDIYQDIAENLETRLDTSNYELDSLLP